MVTSRLAPAARLLYLDTETTGLAGGTGTYAFLVGAGYFDGDAFEVRQYFMRDLDQEPALIAALEGLLGRFDGLVTYNGNGFDLPLLETRFVLARRRWRGDTAHLDLLRPARRLWSARLPDCRLGTVEERVLSFERENDLPGRPDPLGLLRLSAPEGPGQLPRVFEHNRRRHPFAGRPRRLDRGGAGRGAPGRRPARRIWSGSAASGRRPTASEAQPATGVAIEAGLTSPARERVLSRLAREEKRRARWAEARALWEAAARSARAPEGFDAAPWIEMAKIDEHRRRDLDSRGPWSRRRWASPGSTGPPERILAGLGHRLERVTRRLAAGAAAGPG